MGSGASLVVPTRFAEETIAREGEAGRVWIEVLPSRVAEACHRWGLTVDGPPMHGFVAVVVPVLTTDHGRAVLKVPWVEEETEHEALALRTWDGAGAVRVLAATVDDPAPRDPERMLLLERLDGDRTLLSVADHEAATAVAADVLSRLHLAPPPGLRTLTDQAARWVDELPWEWEHHGRPLDRSLLDDAIDTCRHLGPDHPQVLLHGDFHYANVLAGERERWLAIDPKPLAGDPGFDVVPLLWNRWQDLVATGDTVGAIRRRFALAVERAGIDRERARRWSIVRAVDNVLWAVDHRSAEWTSVQVAIAEALA
ncbi:MAG: aminoglycoside phosphotransferase family protein [Acidimicrobiales bacterium]